MTRKYLRDNQHNSKKRCSVIQLRGFNYFFPISFSTVLNNGVQFRVLQYKNRYPLILLILFTSGCCVDLCCLSRLDSYGCVLSFRGLGLRLRSSIMSALDTAAFFDRIAQIVRKGLLLAILDSLFITEILFCTFRCRHFMKVGVLTPK